MVKTANRSRKAAVRSDLCPVYFRVSLFCAIISLLNSFAAVSTEPSPYPQIDAFIRSELSRRCDGGYVRGWQYNEDAKLLQYTFGACKNTHNSASAFILSVFTKI